MNENLNIFATESLVAENLTLEIIKKIRETISGKTTFNIALSGGSTPKLFFKVLGEKFSDAVPWELVHIFWADERFVPPDDPESNYGMTKKILIDKIKIPTINVHRIRGEDDINKESERYAHEIGSILPFRGGFPLFDLILLGIGEDGHTASIFPGHLDLIDSPKFCEVAYHPESRQPRLTLTGKIINNAEEVIFLVTGNKKAKIIDDIIKNSSASKNFPASFIVPVFGSLKWFIDEEAGSLLKLE